MEYRNIIKMNQDLMVFLQEIIYLKKDIGWGLYNKSWWICKWIFNMQMYNTHWIALFCKKKWNCYFHSFGAEYIPSEIKEFIKEFPGNKNIKTNIFWVQEDNLIMCGYFCIGFIDFMLAGKKLTDYTNLFSPHDLKKKKTLI